MKVAISYTSVENAIYNMNYELPHWNFKQVKKTSEDEWNRWLGRIRVSGGTRQQQVKFYTDLWHALQGRRIVSDANGYYIDNTGSEPVVRRVRMKDGKPVFPHYNFDSLWGAHWSINILWSMVYPELMDGFCNTMIDMYRNGGQIPRGPAGGDYTYIMVGDPATSFFANAYNKGIRNYDIEIAYEGLMKNAFEEGIRDSAVWRKAHNGSMKYYLNHGFVPEGVLPGKDRGASLTLEYAYQDWCLAQLSKQLGKKDDYDMLMNRAQNYKHLWNPANRYVHPREEDGSWITDFKPIADAKTTRGFVEANASIYTHFVPHDIAGLARLFGGNHAYNNALNHLFEKAKNQGFVAKTRKMHASGWINYANEPGHAMGHLFNHSGAPYLTQKWVREVKAVFNDTTPYGGYFGDEDQGKAGALGVLMAIGLFEVDGGASYRPFYEITSPVFDEVVIELNQNYYPGERFVIKTKNNGKKNMYIESAKLNGKEWDQCWFYHATFANGGILELVLDDKPNKNWGTDRLPPSMSGVI
jgi:predicted alpha-1,2-mannosidase